MPNNLGTTSTTNTTSTTAKTHLGIISLYTTLSLLLTWPLASHIFTHVPGMAQWAFDESTFIWNIWYLKHALVDGLHTPLQTELIYYPLGIDLVLYTYNFFHALIAQPLYLAVNLPFASNAALLLSSLLSGYGTFLLVRYLLRKEQWGSQRSISLIAFIAGLLYAFASNRAIYAALGHYDMVTTQWIPFYALMLLRSLDGQLTPSSRYKAAGLAGLFFAFNGLAEMITAVFLAIFTIIVIVIHIGQRLWQGRDKSLPFPLLPFPALIASLLITGLIAFALWSPVLIPILTQFLTNDFALKGWGEAIPLSTDLLGWFRPTLLHPLFGGELIPELRRVQLRALELGVTGFRDVNTVFLGWTSFLVALLGAICYWRKARIWIWTTITFGLFTLGPFLQINGEYLFDLDGVEATFPMPYALLHYIPIVKANRAPNRNSVLLMLGLAVLVGYGLYALNRALNQRGWGLGRRDDGSGRGGAERSSALANYTFIAISVMAAGLILFEHLAIPLPLSDARIPAVYEEIAADPEPTSLMQLPLGWRNSFGTFGPERTLLQYYQSAHAKPMLGGNISRAPDFKMDYFKRIPFFQVLTDIESGRPVSPERLAEAKAQVDELIYLYNVGYLLRYPPIEERFPYADHWQATWDFAQDVLPLDPEPFSTADGIDAYRLVQPDGRDHFELDLGVAGSYPYRGEGWDGAAVDEPYSASAIWATAPESRLFIPLRHVDDATTYTVATHVHPFAYPGSPPQSVTLMVNGTPFEQRQLRDEWQVVEWSIPGTALTDGLNRLQLNWAEIASPRQVMAGNRLIGTSGLSLPIDVEMNGFADGGFIALFDEDGVQSDGSAGRRGINVTTLDPQTGAVLQKEGFDTAANTFESQRLAEFLSTVAAGTPVLLVSRGDATAFLTEEAVEQLQALGVAQDLQALKGQHFSIVGLSGAPSATAAVALDPNGAFLRIGLHPDRRTLAGAVDWVTVGRP